MIFGNSKFLWSDKRRGFSLQIEYLLMITRREIVLSESYWAETQENSQYIKKAL
jgi:hypothetical protein